MVHRQTNGRTTDTIQTNQQTEREINSTASDTYKLDTDAAKNVTKQKIGSN